MQGVVSPVSLPLGSRELEIVVQPDSFSIGRHQFRRPSDDVLEMFTKGILNVLDDLCRASRHSIDLAPEVCKASLVSLAKEGRMAYKVFFGEDRPSKILASRLTEGVAPTFVSESTAFPWEVLFGGTEDDYEAGNADCFWGFRYTPARILDLSKDVIDFPSEQSSPSDMLFCMHHKLMQAHQYERPLIEQIVRATRADRFTVFGPQCSLAVCEGTALKGDDLLKYLYKARHNMLHFACHCQKSPRGDDMLLVSFINEEATEAEPPILELETCLFLLPDGQFLYQPLIFLNACQSAGGPDDIRRTFNLPKYFMQKEAAAVIATACPVPDCFAAAFAKKFYEYFLKGAVVENDAAEQPVVRLISIGEALKRTRWHFFKEHNNPLGLSYGLYSPAHYRLAVLPIPMAA